MKNFDDLPAQDRTFQVGGETFKWHNVRPETMFALADELSKNGNDKTGLEALDAQVQIFLPEEEHDRWKQLREREQDPVTLGQLQEVTEWLVAEQSNRPTVTPSPSAPGRGRTAASSKDA